MNKKTYILTLSCPDQIGIVAAVTGKLASINAFITESSQFGDHSTGKFFMRTVFEIESYAKQDIERIFKEVADHFNMKWALYYASYTPKVLVMVSTLSHCLNDLLHRTASKLLPMEIALVVSNHTTLKKMVEMHDIPFVHLPVHADNKPLQEKALLKLIEQHHIDFLILARYMQILSKPFCTKLEGKTINIHHSFLPSFKGAKPYHQAYEKGVKIIGATAHYVTEDLDEGPIIEQEVVRVNHSHTPEKLVVLGQDIEALVLARAVKLHIEHRVLINQNKTVIFN
jgi:formyltetrahydrofolate deformylase